jgi:hypothetical protein
MKEVDFAIEKGFRYFKDKITYFNFYMIQLQIDKNKVKDGMYSFKLLSDTITYEKSIIIDSIKMRIITPDSHEDPLVESNEKYMLCFQLWDDDFKEIITKKNSEIFYMEFVNENSILFSEKINGNLKDLFKKAINNFSKFKDKYTIYSEKDCVFRLHLGDNKANYQEKEWFLKANENFNFKEYLTYPYVGLQCSYEGENPEIEEKHIVIGQKGMTLSGEYLDGEDKYEALLPFNNLYQILYSNKNIAQDIIDKYAFFIKEDWLVVNSIDDLITFYMKEKYIKFFESSLNFLENQYRTKKTYGINKVIAKSILGKCHLDLNLCTNCKYNSKCIQIVPSGISPLLFKRNILLDEEKNCSIYKLIDTAIK